MTPEGLLLLTVVTVVLVGVYLALEYACARARSRPPRARRRSVTSPSDRTPAAVLSATPGERRWRA